LLAFTSGRIWLCSCKRIFHSFKMRFNRVPAAALVRIMAFARNRSGDWIRLSDNCSTCLPVRSLSIMTSRNQTNSPDVQKVVQSLMNSDLSHKIRRDTKLYEIKSTGHLWRIHLLSVATCFFAVYFAIFLTYIGSTYADKVTVDQQQSSGYQFLARFARFVGDHWFTFSVAVVLFALVEVALCSMFVCRHVASIELLQGGQQVRLKLFSMIPNQKLCRTVTMPLSDVGALNSRHEPGQYLSLLGRSRRLSWVVDKEGHFPFPALFDTTVGLHRSFGAKPKK
jgi:hypothetical protein